MPPTSLRSPLPPCRGDAHVWSSNPVTAGQCPNLVTRSATQIELSDSDESSSWVFRLLCSWQGSDTSSPHPLLAASVLQVSSSSTSEAVQGSSCLQSYRQQKSGVKLFPRAGSKSATSKERVRGTSPAVTEQLSKNRSPHLLEGKPFSTG